MFVRTHFLLTKIPFALFCIVYCTFHLTTVFGKDHLSLFNPNEMSLFFSLELLIFEIHRISTNLVQVSSTHYMNKIIILLAFNIHET